MVLSYDPLTLARMTHLHQYYIVGRPVKAGTAQAVANVRIPAHPPCMTSSQNENPVLHTGDGSQSSFLKFA